MTKHQSIGYKDAAEKFVEELRRRSGSAALLFSLSRRFNISKSTAARAARYLADNDCVTLGHVGRKLHLRLTEAAKKEPAAVKRHDDDDGDERVALKRTAAVDVVHVDLRKVLRVVLESGSIANEAKVKLALQMIGD